MLRRFSISLALAFIISFGLSQNLYAQSVNQEPQKAVKTVEKEKKTSTAAKTEKKQVATTAKKHMPKVANKPAEKSSNKRQILKKIKYASLPNNGVAIELQFSSPFVGELKEFDTKNPPRIILDLPNTTNILLKPQQLVDIGPAHSVNVVDSGGRTRLVVNLNKAVPYKTRVNGNTITIILHGSLVDGTPSHEKFIEGNSALLSKPHSIKRIDFRKTGDDGSKIIIDISDSEVGINLRQEGTEIIAEFSRTTVPSRLIRRLDVTDFGTSVQTVDVVRDGKDVQLKINAKGNYEHLAYQIDNQFIIEVKPLTEAQLAAQKEPSFSGERLSLNFQDIKIRAALQLIAEFSGLNIVVSDTVRGSITLRLKNVPWDQALDIILKTRGLGKRKVGNVLMVAPASEVAAHEREELQAKAQVQQLAPLHTELIQVNYASATTLSTLLREKGNSILSDRGAVSVDVRTNQLLVQDTAEKLQEVRQLIHRLDVPVKQVLIEARLVNVENKFEQDLGIRWGITSPTHTSGTLEGANEVLAAEDPLTDILLNNRLNIDLGAQHSEGNRTAKFGIALQKLGADIMLDLELSALESQGEAEIISSPRLITANQQEAVVLAGEEIPYQQATSSGAVSVAFKKAVLSLKVTPQITPDNKILLTIKINQDKRGRVTAGGIPAIDTRQLETRVLVNNGQTVVLGGIYEQTKRHDVNRVPFLGTLPIIGYIFRSTQEIDDRKELLIFVTPKIIQPSLDVG